MARELTEKQIKKKQKITKMKTRLRVQKHRQKKKDEGYATITITLSPENKAILDKYQSFLKKGYITKNYSYNGIFDNLIGKILKSRNESFYLQGLRY